MAANIMNQLSDLGILLQSVKMNQLQKLWIDRKNLMKLIDNFIPKNNQVISNRNTNQPIKNIIQRIIQISIKQNTRVNLKLQQQFSQTICQMRESKHPLNKSKIRKYKKKTNKHGPLFLIIMTKTYHIKRCLKKKKLHLNTHSSNKMLKNLIMKK
jgi:hypothetical protein